MEWLVFKEIDSSKIHIKQFGERIKYCYPKSFVEIVMQYDGGSPESMNYNTTKTDGRVFNNLISFDQEQQSSIWYMIEDNSKGEIEWNIDGLRWQYIPFAEDPFGNFICFDRNDDHIVFWDHETCEIEDVAVNFTKFVDSLYEIDREALFKKYFN